MAVTAVGIFIPSKKIVKQANHSSNLLKNLSNQQITKSK
jgi:hypothetical protein